MIRSSVNLDSFFFTYEAVSASRDINANDFGKYLEVDPGGGIVELTLPTGLGRGFRFNIRQVGTGVVRVLAGAGATLTSTGGAGTIELPGQWSNGLFDSRTDTDWIGQVFESALEGGIAVSVTDSPFNAQGDGTTDDTAAINAAAAFVLSQGGGWLWFPAGTYFVTSQITLPDGVTFVGAGPDVSVITADGVAAGNFVNNAIIYNEGSSAALPALGASVVAGDLTITFSAAHGLSVDSLFTLKDPANGSYNSARTYYNQGEFIRVEATPLATTATADAPAYGDYNLATAEVNEITPITVGMRDLAVVGIGTGTVSCVTIVYGRNCRFERLRFTNTQLAGLEVDRCFDTWIDSVEGFSFLANIALNYLISIVNCQRGTCSKILGATVRHAITTGGADTDDNVVVRDWTIADCVLAGASAGVGAVGIHGNAEYLTVADCDLVNIAVAGDHIAITNCTLRAESNGIAATIQDLIGTDIRFSDCRFYQTTDLAAGIAMVNFDDSLPNLSRTDGVFTFSNCLFEMFGFDGIPVQLDNYDLVEITNRVLFEGCTFNSTSGDDACLAFVRSNSGVASGWGSVEFSNNRFYGCGARVSSALEAHFHNNLCLDSPDHGLRVANDGNNPHSSQLVEFLGNTVYRAQDAGIAGNLDSAGTPGTSTFFKAMGNISLNNNQSTSATENASFWVTQCEDAIISNNIYGDNQAAPTQTRIWELTNVTTIQAFGNIITGTIVAFTNTGVTNIFRGQMFPATTEFLYTEGIRVGIGGGSPQQVGSQADDLVVGATTRAEAGISGLTDDDGSFRLVVATPTRGDNTFGWLYTDVNQAVAHYVGGDILLRAQNDQAANVFVRPNTDNDTQLGNATAAWESVSSHSYLYGTGSVSNTAGAGTPEGTVTAPVGSFYLDTTNGTLYIKKSGAGNTGWERAEYFVCKAAADLASSTAANWLPFVGVSEGTGAPDYFHMFPRPGGRTIRVISAQVYFEADTGSTDLSIYSGDIAAQSLVETVNGDPGAADTSILYTFGPADVTADNMLLEVDPTDAAAGIFATLLCVLV